MDELKVFENPEFGKVRIVDMDGEPWMSGKDVAIALGYSNPYDALAKHVNSEDKDVYRESRFHRQNAKYAHHQRERLVQSGAEFQIADSAAV